MNFSGIDTTDIQFWDYKQGSYFKFNPIYGSSFYTTKEHYGKCEYIQSVKTYHDKKRLALIGDGHNYGATGIFIINISDFESFKPILQLVDSSGLYFQCLDINKTGTELTTVISHENQNLSINVFEMSSSKMKKFASLNLKHNNDNHPLDIKYIHERIVLIFNSKILIIRTHDLVCLKTLHRDVGSDWSADGDKIFYCNSNVFYIYDTNSTQPPNSGN